MTMYCNQCQETAKNIACTIKGVCGKDESTANLQDLLVHTLKGLALAGEPALNNGGISPQVGRFVSESLFATITNANFDEGRFEELIHQALKQRDQLKQKYTHEPQHDSVQWSTSQEKLHTKASRVAGVGFGETGNEDIRSLRELLLYGLKGIAAYTHHAERLGHSDANIHHFMIEALAASAKDLSQEELLGIVMQTGEIAVKAMALLDQANTETYGHPEISRVNIGTGERPGILISGHDLKDMEELLHQTQDTGVDVYTHSEMLPAHYYPSFKKYDHFVGNYGNAWWQQGEEFAQFNGPILMTTNCITPVKDAYKDRIYTTGVVGYPEVQHIPEDENGRKDFAQIIKQAQQSPPPEEIESGEIIGGFAHNQVMELADKIVEAVQSGDIRQFIVMAGCDGRHKGRDYYTDLARKLPQDTVILTAGCAKYRYNKLDLGDINGIPRVLDAGQCNDSFSLAVTALKLKEVFELNDINELPISYDIAWYEQKAVAVLLALLHLGVKGIRLGPTLPGFLSENVANILVEKFDLKPIASIEEDLQEMMPELVAF